MLGGGTVVATPRVLGSSAGSSIASDIGPSFITFGSWSLSCGSSTRLLFIIVCTVRYSYLCNRYSEVYSEVARQKKRFQRPRRQDDFFTSYSPLINNYCCYFLYAYEGPYERCIELELFDTIYS
jgi:hypothetical protein